MQIVNLATVAVDTTAGGTVILTEGQAKAATTYGLEAVIINPSVDLVLISSNVGAFSNIPDIAGTGIGPVVGTAANSPFVCPAGTATVVLHRGGKITAISTAGTSTVKIGLGCAP